MADYVIGDVQGCYLPLLRLLEEIQFNEKSDRLMFVGDLVNRGPQSLDVLRFIKNLPIKPIITLGNHDLFLLAKIFTTQKHWLKKEEEDTLGPILQAKDCEALGHWLRQQSILYHDPNQNVVISHAGIPPIWNLEEAKAYALELEQSLAGEGYVYFLEHMYGNHPHCWSKDLQGIDRLRLITNYFTRMRLCDEKGCLFLDKKEERKENLFPWFVLPGRVPIQADIVFGHWAALGGVVPSRNMHALDTGCVWGGELSALRLGDRKRFSVSGV